MGQKTEQKKVEVFTILNEYVKKKTNLIKNYNERKRNEAGASDQKWTLHLECQKIYLSLSTFAIYEKHMTFKFYTIFFILFSLILKIMLTMYEFRTSTKRNKIIVKLHHQEALLYYFLMKKTT